MARKLDLSITADSKEEAMKLLKIAANHVKNSENSIIDYRHYKLVDYANEPKPDRDKKICDEFFSGASAVSLAVKYDLTPTRVHQIIRKAKFRKSQSKHAL